MEAPLTLFVWSAKRIVPVRITEFSITEEAFDPALNPIRAKVSLGLRVLSVNDLGFAHKGGTLFMAYLQRKEQLAGEGAGGRLRRWASEGFHERCAEDPRRLLQSSAAGAQLFPPTSRYSALRRGR